MLAIAGASTYVWSWKIGIAVALVMLTVVATYRQTVHAYPSGGGDYEVATVNLGRNAGITVASALLVDYVLTVAVSISSAAQYAAGAIDGLIGHEATVAVVAVDRADRDEPARRARVGRVLRRADLPLHGGHPRHVRLRAAAAARRRPAAGRERRPGDRARRGLGRPADADRPDVPARSRLLLGLCGPDGRRGDQQRRTRLPQAEEPQRGDHAAAARPDRGHHDDERHRAGQADGDPLRRPARARAAAHGRRWGAARGLRPAPGDRPDRGRRLRRLLAGLLLRRHRHRHHPGAGGQHRVQRLPGARLDPRPGRAGAAVARLARRPARLQQRHRLPGRDVDPADRRLRRRDHQADPALHRRRLRLLQPQPARHDPALDAAPEDRDGPGRPPPDEAVAGDQHVRPGHDRRGAGDRADHQVPGRRLDHHPRHGVLLLRDAGRSAATTPASSSSSPPTSRTR